ncbi:hypothetical protein QT711_18295 [Sporosarcina saromensis]|uniref:Uncharacterized protein n=2 Tax=Sporosarcina saromensis TaxID=359365 RepID=A0ABU4GDP9_9BACL|nr:hypothetical protein [Sporosarcina saromensis]
MRYRLMTICLLSALITTVLVNSKSAKEVNILSEQPTDLTIYAEKYSDLMQEITQELRINKVRFVLDYAILPDETIEIFIKLPSEEIENRTKIEIEQLVIEVLREKEFNPDQFHLKISSYYETPSDDERSSVRLSYNDLMGNLMQELKKRNHLTFSLEYAITPRHVEVIINLPVDSTENTKLEVEQSAKEVIKRNKYAINDFQITIVSKILTK